MPRIAPHQEQIGFVTIAQNTNVDYLNIAYVQAMSIKLSMPSAKYAVIVDANTNAIVTDQHRTVFDYVIQLQTDYATDEEWKLSNEWQVFELTPFKETIKVESDIVFTRDIMHWLHAFRLRDIVLSTGCKNYRQRPSDSRAYRKVFDDNNLPDVYNGLMYFRYSKTAAEFFRIARVLFENWDTVSPTLKNCRDLKPTTDVVYALTANILGREQCTIPSMDFINFVHMKPAINNWANADWDKLAVSETDLPMIRIANTNQYHPVHIHSKAWFDTVREEYENKFIRHIA